MTGLPQRACPEAIQGEHRHAARCAVAFCTRGAAALARAVQARGPGSSLRAPRAWETLSCLMPRSGVDETLPTDTRPELGADVLVVLGDAFARAAALTRPLVIGRDPACDVYVDDPSVSRRHAEISPGSPPTLRDLGSKNGCRIGGMRLTPDVPVALEPGKVAEVGSVLVVVQRGESVEQAASAASRATKPRTTTTSTTGDTDHDVVLGGAVARMLDLVDRVAQASLSVLLCGETGVGKDVFAELIHQRSPRRARPFARIHCAAISESLFESELFGHEQGAFTGAAKARAGLLESADGGTVFLDEIGELPQTTQVKLLRVLEDRRVTRVGSVRSQKIDVRFVAATNRDLEEEVERGTFRRDLFFRLNGISLTIPPLRERTDEIEPLARRFFQRATGRPLELSPSARAALLAHPFEGNIRELRNVVERAALLSGEGVVDVAHLQLSTSSPGPAVPASLTAPQQAEARRILAALAQCAGSQTEAAKVLGISRRTLINRLDAYGLPRPRK